VTPPAAAAAPAIRRARTTAPRPSAPRPSVAPRRPRRVSGPARRAPGALPRVAEAERGLVLGLLDGLAGISRHQTLDRLIRGRTWIALIAFALIGIVTLQLLVLTLNAHIGRALVHEARLQRENATLSIESSELAAGERVESLASRLGMELVQVSAVRFLSVDPRIDVARAAAALSAPAAPVPTTAPAQGEPAASASGETTSGAG
jgi:cell division protein FtsL